MTIHCHVLVNNDEIWSNYVRPWNPMINRINRSTVLLLIFVLMLSILVANVADLINVDTYVLKDQNEESLVDQSKFFEINDSFDHLMWFLQISDIHISIFQDSSRISELKKFCNVTIDAFKPWVVLASGDLTDAKAKDAIGSGQLLGEWEFYKHILDETRVREKTLWLDVRGNHDNFNIINLESKHNYYAKYSIQGQIHSRSYMYQIEINSDKYAFIAIDACLKPGPKRPFNFIGILDGKEINKIEEFVNETKNHEADYIIWFGHYPTSCILSQAEGGVRNIIGKNKESMVYLCGHLHSLGGMVPNMYTLQQAGFLELELADWKESRMFRVAAIDHGQLSFYDVKHDQWPVILITNPKHALYTMPRKENMKSIISSTHIRVLVFSPAKILKVEVQLDDGIWFQCEHIKGPLYVKKWNTLNYLEGIHRIEVRAVDGENREQTVSQPFSLDGSRLSFKFLPRLLLMSNISHIFQFLFATILMILVLPLCIFRLLHILHEGKRIHRPRLRIQCFHRWFRKLWILSSIDRLFFPLVLYALYLAIGPWTVGEVIENHTGVIFAWGTFVGHHYLPGAFTYVYGFFQLFTFHFPLMFILAHRVDIRLKAIQNPCTQKRSTLKRCWQHFPISLLISMEVVMASLFYLSYGILATILCPLRTWSFIMAVILYYEVHNMPLSCLSSAAAVWSHAVPSRQIST